MELEDLRTFLDYYHEVLSSLNFENVQIQSIEITNNVVVTFVKNGTKYSSTLPLGAKK